MALTPYELIRDLAVIMVVSGLMALVFHKLKQPLIVGYILAGIIIGPYTYPGSLVLDINVVNELAQIGVVMLLFVVGLEFPVEKLTGKFRKIAVIAGVEVASTYAVSILVGSALHLSFYDSLFAGLGVTVTSTVVITKVLTELGVLRDEATTLVVSVSIVEDVIVLTILAMLQSVASSGGPSLFGISFALELVIFFVAGTLIIGGRLVPRVINWIGEIRSDEILVLAMLAVAFGLSIIANIIGISVATGAFFAGVLVSRSNYHEVTKFLASPLRDMFAALFFVSMGALMDFSLIPIFIVPALILLLVSIAMKFASVLLTSRSMKYSGQTSVKAAFGLSASGGELGLVVAKGGVDTGAASAFLLPMLGVITVLTTFLSPYIIRIGWRSFLGGKATEQPQANEDRAANSSLPESGAPSVHPGGVAAARLPNAESTVAS